MFYFKAFCFMAIIFSIVIDVQAMPGQITDESEMFYFLISGMQSNLEKAGSGKGVLMCKSQGEYFAPSSKKPLEFSAQFAFDGEKIRYDRTFGYERRSTKDAKDGRYHFGYIRYLDHDEPYVIPNAYVRPLEYLHGSEFFGEIVDLKRIMKPLNNTLEELFLIAKEKIIKKTIEEQSDGTFLVRIFSPHESGTELQLWFDPQKGFNIIHEKMIQKGVETDKIERAFQEIDNIWMLKSLRYTRYDHEANSEGKHLVVGEQYFEVNELSLNEEIPDETFNLKGFDLRPKTKIWDMVTGVSYTLDPIVAVEDQVFQILESLETPEVKPATKEIATSQDQLDRQEPTLSSKKKQDTDFDAAQEIDSQYPRETKDLDKLSSNITSIRNVVYIVVITCAFLGGVYCWSRRRGSKAED